MAVAYVGVLASACVDVNSIFTGTSSADAAAAEHQSGQADDEMCRTVAEREALLDALAPGLRCGGTSGQIRWPLARTPSRSTSAPQAGRKRWSPGTDSTCPAGGHGQSRSLSADRSISGVTVTCCESS